MPGRKVFLLVLLFLGMFPASGAGENRAAQDSMEFRAKRIAHAGGAFNSRKYTNSYQALDQNIANGFEYFEIDFVFTSDGHLVCLHDWAENFARTFGFSTNEPLSLEEFRQLAAVNAAFTNCTLDGLATWMRRNTKASIVTDVRGDNLSALAIIRDTLPEPTRRVIPQIYHPRSFPQVKAMGFEQIIWTLYRLRLSDDQVLAAVQHWPRPFAVTMPKTRAQSMLPTLLAVRRIPTYVHTVNSADDFKKFIGELAVTEVYTDFLAPVSAD